MVNAKKKSLAKIESTVSSCWISEHKIVNNNKSKQPITAKRVESTKAVHWITITKSFINWKNIFYADISK